MDLLRPCLFFYLLAILLSLSISSTTNSDPTNAEAEAFQWKGGDGAKRSRVRRQNLHLPHALRLPEKAYAFYMLWRLLNEMYNDTNTINPLTTRPDKLEFTTSEGPKSMEIEDRPSSAPIQEQSTHSNIMSSTIDSTAMASETPSLDSQKTTQDLQLVDQSTQLQTTIQKIRELNQTTEQNISDSTTLKNPNIAAEESSTMAIHEQIDHSTSINGTNNSTAMVSFPTDSLPDSQVTTKSGDLQLPEESTQHFQTTIQKITGPSEATEQHFPDSTTFTIKISSKAAEEPSSITIQEQMDHFSGVNGTNNSTAMPSFSTHSSPDSQEITQSGNSQLVEQSAEHFRTTKHKITEPNPTTEQHIPDSTTFKIPTIAAEEPFTITIHEQLDHFTGVNGTNNSTAVTSFPSQVTEQHILDSTTLNTKISKAAEEPSSITIHEQMDHFTGVNGTNNSTAMPSFPTHSLPDSQEITPSGDPQLVEQSAESFPTIKQKTIEPNQTIEHDIPDSTIFKIPTIAAEEPSTIAIHEQMNHFTGINGTNNSTAVTSFPSQVTEQHILDFTTLNTKISKAAEEPSSITIHEQMDHFTGDNGTNASTAMPSFPTHSLPDSQEKTPSGDTQLVEQSAESFQTIKQKTIEPNQTIEYDIPDSTTFKIPTIVAKETSTNAIHEQIDHFTGDNGTNNSTAVTSFPTHSLPDSQETTHSGDPQLVEKSAESFQTTKQKTIEPNQTIEHDIPDSTTFKIPTIAAEENSTSAIHEQIDHFTGDNGTNNSTAVTSFPTHSLPDSQETTHSGDPQLVEQSAESFKTTKQKITDPSQVIEQDIPDFTTLKIPTIAAEEPSTIAIHEQMDHFTGVNGTNNSTAMPSFPTHSLPDLQEITPSGDPQFVEQSAKSFQTIKQKTIEPNQTTEHDIPDSTTYKIPTIAAEETSTNAIHEQIDHFTGDNGTNDSTAISSFPTESLPDSQEITPSGDPQLVEQSAESFQTIKQETIEPNQTIEHDISDSTTFKIPTIAEENSTSAIHEQIDHFTGDNGTNNSTTVTSFPTHSLPDSQETTHSGDPQLVEKSAESFQTTKQKTIEPNQTIEHDIPDSTTFKIPTIAEENSTSAIHEQIDHFTGDNGTNNSTTVTSFPTHSLPDSQEITPSGDPQLVEQSAESFQTIKQKTIEPNQTIEHDIPDSTTYKIPTIAAEETSTNAIHEQMDHFTGDNGTNDSTAMSSFPTESLPDSQEITPSGDPQLVEQSAESFQTIKQKTIEPNQTIEHDIPDSTTFKIPTIAAEENSTSAVHEQIDHFTDDNGTNNSTAVTSFPTHSLPDSQETTHSEDPQLVEQSAESFKTTKQKITDPNQVVEQDIPDFTTLKIPTIAAEEPSTIAIHEQMDHFTGVNGTNNSTAMPSFPTHSLPDSQEITPSGDPQFVEQSAKRSQTTKYKITEPNQNIEQHIPDSTTFKIPTIAAEENSTSAIHEQIDHFTGDNGTNNSTAVTSFPSQVTEQHILDSTTFNTKISSKAAEEPSLNAIHKQMDNFTGINGTNNSTAMASFPTHSSLADSEETTHSEDAQLVEQSAELFQTTKQKITEPSQVIEQDIPDSTTFKIPTITTEEPSTIAIHKQIGHLTGFTGTKNSAVASFPTHSSLPDSQETAQSGDPQLSEESTQRFHKTEPIIHSTGTNGTNDSIAITLFPTDLPSRESQKNTQSGAPQLLEHSTKIVQPTAHMSKTYRIQQETPLQTAIDPHDILASTMENDNLESTSLPQITKNEQPTLSVTWQNGKPSWIVTTTDWRVSKPMSPTFTLEHQIQDSASPNLDLSVSESTSDPEHHKPKPPHSEKNTTNTSKSSRDSFMQQFTTTNKFTILSKIMSHTSFPLVKDTSTQAPTNGVQSSQTSPNNIYTTSVVRHGFLTSRTKEILSWISRKPSNIQPTETAESRLDPTNQEPTADPMPKEISTNNDLLIKTDKSTQSMSGRKPSTTTTRRHLSKTQTISRKPKIFILPKPKSAITAIEDDKKTRRDIYGLLFTFGCLLLLITVILLREVRRRWQARQWRNYMWVAGYPLLSGTYHSVFQVSSSYTAILMRKEGSQKKKQENSDVHETIVLNQQHIDFV